MSEKKEQMNGTQIFDEKVPGPIEGPVTDSHMHAGLIDLNRHMVFAARLQHGVSMEVGVNPLVAAASEVLAEVVKMRGIDSPPSGNYRNDLIEMIKSFEARAVQAGIASAEVMTARYILCTVVDHAVRNSRWLTKVEEWGKNSLLVMFHNDTLGGTKFFQLVDRMSISPSRHLYLLELMYLCLSIGFAGAHEGTAKGGEYIAATRVKLFQLIRSLRGQALREVSPQWQGLKDDQAKGFLVIPGWMVVAFTLTLAAATYIGMSTVLGHQRQAVLQSYQAFSSTAKDPS